MSRTVITIPKVLDLPNALDVSLKLAKQGKSDEFLFNFANVEFVEPFGMLMVSSEIRRLKSRYPESAFSAANFKHMTYAGHMGFFQAFGLDFGNAPGVAKGGVVYLPVTMFDCAALDVRATKSGREVGDEIEEESKHLSEMLCSSDSGPVFETLAYSLREVMRNVVEHSAAEHICLCAQYWPSKARVEVAIVDLGIGLRSSLSQNPHLDTSDDKKAVNYALMPAVSGKAFKGARRKQKGHWANSGFGLYMTSRICRNGGNYFIASGDTGMLLTTKAEGKRYFNCGYEGTAIRMVMRTDQIANLREALDVYREEGFKIQSRYKEIVSIDPSSASLMLSEDFDLSVWDRLLKTVKGIA